MPDQQFPPDFVFGAATSAYQVEGAWDEDGKGPSIWDTFSQTPGHVDRDIPGDDGADHYHRTAEDLALLSHLGVDSYRFSLSWPRLLPEGTGRVNPRGAAFYDRLIDDLLAAGITPNATLYHWDLPQALEDRGGWPNRDIADWFAEYAAVAFSRFGDRVRWWSTINEPIALWVGYGLGVFAPGRADPAAGKAAMHNALRAHGRAVDAFRAAGCPGDIGIVLDIWQRHPATGSPADRALADQEEDDGFRFFLGPLFAGGYSDRLRRRLEAQGVMPAVAAGDLELIARPIDFLGLNVYSRVVVDAANHNPLWWTAGDTRPGGNFLSNGMEFYPEALYDAAAMVRRDYHVTLPLFITENGLGLPDEPMAGGRVEDDERIRYIHGFLAQLLRARADGHDIRGYYLWSLLDNYEWAAGFSQRYGLVHVDPATKTRTPKASFDWYRALIAARSLIPPTPVTA
ncbi:MAG: beta-glucosidase, partial [Propionibacteriaceae bacterium]|nr:beta-glucosidase [Propionibacteriaceae bacterium]